MIFSVDNGSGLPLYTTHRRRPPRFAAMTRLWSSSLVQWNAIRQFSDVELRRPFGSPKGGGMLCSRAVWQVNMKKEKRRRRSPCGPSPRRRSNSSMGAVMEETSAVW